MKPKIDNKSPKRFTPSRKSSTKLSNSRRREIDHENNQLLLKMLNIMHRGTNKTQPNSPHFSQTGKISKEAINNMSMYLNNNNSIREQSPSFTSSAQGLQKQSPVHSRANLHTQDQQLRSSNPQFSQSAKISSLNFYKRKKDVDKINQNNKQLLKSLQNVQPVIKRDDLKHHENRIKKLKQHIGQVRYGNEQNFLFPLSPQENHNFHSSQFIFVKNPSIVNISPSQNVKKTRLNSGIYRSGNLFIDTENKIKTAQGKRQRSNGQLNKSADFSKNQMKRISTPTNQQQYFFQQPPQFQGGQMPLQAKKSTKILNRSFQNKSRKVVQRQNLSHQPSKESLYTQKQFERPRTGTTTFTQVPHCYYEVKKLALPDPENHLNPYYEVQHPQPKKFIVQRPSSGLRHSSQDFNNSSQNLLQINGYLTNDSFNIEQDNINKSMNINLNHHMQAQDSTIKFVTPKIQVNGVAPENLTAQFNHNLHFQMNNDQQNFEQKSPEFKQINTGYDQRKMNFTNSTQKKNLEKTALDFLVQQKMAEINDQKSTQQRLNDSDSRLSPIKKQNTKENVNKFLNIANCNNNFKQRVEQRVKQFIEIVKNNYYKKKKERQQKTVQQEKQIRSSAIKQIKNAQTAKRFIKTAQKQKDFNQRVHQRVLQFIEIVKNNYYKKKKEGKLRSQQKGKQIRSTAIKQIKNAQTAKNFINNAQNQKDLNQRVQKRVLQFIDIVKKNYYQKKKEGKLRSQQKEKQIRGMAIKQLKSAQNAKKFVKSAQQQKEFKQRVQQRVLQFINIVKNNYYQKKKEGKLRSQQKEKQIRMTAIKQIKNSSAAKKFINNAQWQKDFNQRVQRRVLQFIEIVKNNYYLKKKEGKLRSQQKDKQIRGLAMKQLKSAQNAKKFVKNAQQQKEFKQRVQQRVLQFIRIVKNNYYQKKKEGKLRSQQKQNQIRMSAIKQLKNAQTANKFVKNAQQQKEFKQRVLQRVRQFIQIIKNNYYKKKKEGKLRSQQQKGKQIKVSAIKQFNYTQHVIKQFKNTSKITKFVRSAKQQQEFKKRVNQRVLQFIQIIKNNYYQKKKVKEFAAKQKQNLNASKFLRQAEKQKQFQQRVQQRVKQFIQIIKNNYYNKKKLKQQVLKIQKQRKNVTSFIKQTEKNKDFQKRVQQRVRQFIEIIKNNYYQKKKEKSVIKREVSKDNAVKFIRQTEKQHLFQQRVMRRVKQFIQIVKNNYYQKKREKEYIRQQLKSYVNASKFIRTAAQNQKFQNRVLQRVKQFIKIVKDNYYQKKKERLFIRQQLKSYMNASKFIRSAAQNQQFQQRVLQRVKQFIKIVKDNYYQKKKARQFICKQLKTYKNASKFIKSAAQNQQFQQRVLKRVQQFIEIVKNNHYQMKKQKQYIGKQLKTYKNASKFIRSAAQNQQFQLRVLKRVKQFIQIVKNNYYMVKKQRQYIGQQLRTYKNASNFIKTAAQNQQFQQRVLKRVKQFIKIVKDNYYQKKKEKEAAKKLFGQFLKKNDDTPYSEYIDTIEDFEKSLMKDQNQFRRQDTSQMQMAMNQLEKKVLEIANMEKQKELKKLEEQKLQDKLKYDQEQQRLAKLATDAFQSKKSFNYNIARKFVNAVKSEATNNRNNKNDQQAFEEKGRQLFDKIKKNNRQRRIQAKVRFFIEELKYKVKLKKSMGLLQKVVVHKINQKRNQQLKLNNKEDNKTKQFSSDPKQVATKVLSVFQPKHKPNQLQQLVKKQEQQDKESMNKLKQAFAQGFKQKSQLDKSSQTKLQRFEAMNDSQKSILKEFLGILQRKARITILKNKAISIFRNSKSLKKQATQLKQPMNKSKMWIKYDDVEIDQKADSLSIHYSDDMSDYSKPHPGLKQGFEKAQDFISALQIQDAILKNKSLSQQLAREQKRMIDSDIKDNEYQQAILKDTYKFIALLLSRPPFKRSTQIFKKYIVRNYISSIVQRLREVQERLSKNINGDFKNIQLAQSILKVVQLYDEKEQLLQERGMNRIRQYQRYIKRKVQEKKSKLTNMIGIAFLKNDSKFNFQVGTINDKNFMRRYKQDFRRHLVRLFILNKSQRKTKVHFIYFIQNFRKSLIRRLEQLYYENLLTSYFSEDQKTMIQGYLYIQEQREQYKKKKALILLKQYMKKLQQKALQRKVIKISKELRKLIVYHLIGKQKLRKEDILNLLKKQ